MPSLTFALPAESRLPPIGARRVVALPSTRRGAGPVLTLATVGSGHFGQKIFTGLLSVGTLAPAALERTDQMQHPFGGVASFESPDISGMQALQPSPHHPHKPRYRLIEGQGLALSQGHWSLASQATPGMQVALPAATVWQRDVTVEPGLAALMERRRSTWWWLAGRWAGFNFGVFGHPGPTVQQTLRDPHGYLLSPGDLALVQREPTITFYPGALLGHAVGVWLAAALLLGAQVGAGLGWVTALSRLGVHVRCEIPAWAWRLGYGASLQYGEDGGLRLSYDDRPRFALRVERREDMALGVELTTHRATTWESLSFDVPFVAAAHIGRGERRNSVYRSVLAGHGATSRLTYSLLYDIYRQGMLEGSPLIDQNGAFISPVSTASSASSPLLAESEHENRVETSSSHGIGVHISGLSLGTHPLAMGRFSDYQTLRLFWSQGEEQQLWHLIRKVEERQNFWRGHDLWVTSVWGKQRGQRVLRSTLPRAAQVSVRFAAFEWQHAVALAEEMGASQSYGARWPQRHRDLLLHVQWRIWQAGQWDTMPAAPPAPSLLEQELLSIKTWDLNGLARFLRGHLRDPRAVWSVSYAQTQNMIEKTYHFIAGLNGVCRTYDQLQHARKLQRQLTAEMDQLATDPLLKTLAQASLVSHVENLTAALHRLEQVAMQES